jgi:hypothetical protein
VGLPLTEVVVLAVVLTETSNDSLLLDESKCDIDLLKECVDDADMEFVTLGNVDDDTDTVVTLVLCDLDKGWVDVLAPSVMTCDISSTNTEKEVTMRTRILVTVVCSQTLNDTSRNAVTKWMDWNTTFCFSSVMYQPGATHSSMLGEVGDGSQSSAKAKAHHLI